MIAPTRPVHDKKTTYLNSTTLSWQQHIRLQFWTTGQLYIFFDYRAATNFINTTIGNSNENFIFIFELNKPVITAHGPTFRISTWVKYILSFIAWPQLYFPTAFFSWHWVKCIPFFQWTKFLRHWAETYFPETGSTLYNGAWANRSVFQQLGQMHSFTYSWSPTLFLQMGHLRILLWHWAINVVSTNTTFIHNWTKFQSAPGPLPSWPLISFSYSNWPQFFWITINFWIAINFIFTTFGNQYGQFYFSCW